MKYIATFTSILLATCITSQTEEPTTEWDDYFMPGVAYKVYVPKNDSDFGIYQGVAAEFVFYAHARSRRKEKWDTGPSRIKTFGNLCIMKSDNADSKDVFSVNLGVSVSFEGEIERKYLIPYFGLELGSMFQRDYKSLVFSPHIGVQLISTKRLICYFQGGYNYTTKYFDEYSGGLITLGVNLLLWE